MTCNTLKVAFESILTYSSSVAKTFKIDENILKPQRARIHI